MSIARTTAIVALGFVGLSGLVGGIPLIVQARDEPWWMPQSLLQYSPFRSFLIPGIILFSAIGLLSCWVLWLSLARRPGYCRWIVLQGLVLLGWIITEVIMLRLLMWAQVLYGAIGLLLVVAGLVLARAEPRSS